MTIPATPHVAELPAPLSRFVGRARELGDLRRLLDAARLVTLTGPGGSGKTRLAREAAVATAPRFQRMAWVDLAPLCDAGLLADAVAGALDAPDRTGRHSSESVVAAIGTTRVLLVLDNCEHLVDACGELAAHLLRRCPALAILATSREALGVPGETAWLVPPLGDDERVQLFLDRAQAALPGFALTAGNATAIAEICRRLDGIPLALELAAARVRVLSPEQIVARLDDAFRLLAAGSRQAVPRHRTLRAAMTWSHDLLTPHEQLLFRRLSVFAGSFTLEAAEWVCAGAPLDPEEILDGISALVDKSLLVLEPGDSVARYRLLDTVRQYAAEQLRASGDEEARTGRYATHYLEMLEAAAPSLVGGSNSPSLLEALAAERDNIRSATLWAVADAARAELALRFVGAQFWLLYAFGDFREARQLADRALALPGDVDPLHRARALVSSGNTALAQGSYAVACEQFELALPQLRARGDDFTVACALAKLGAARLLRGELGSAVATLDEALAFTAARPAPDIGAIFARYWRAWAAYAEGDLALAGRLLRRNVEEARAHDLPTSLAHAMTSLARIELARGAVADACALVMEGLEREVGIADPWGIGMALDAVAVVAARRGRPEDATRLLGAVTAHRRRHGVALHGIAPQEEAMLVEQLREVLGPQFETELTAGSRLSTADAVELALREAARHTTEHRIVAVTPSERREEPRAQLRVQALGPLVVSVGDRLVDTAAWGSARPRELLAYFLAHPEGRTREQVGLAFWPDASPAQLRNNFHVTVHRLRRALGARAWVVLSGDRYRIDPELVAVFDVASFERDVEEARRALQRGEDAAAARLEAALAHYRGDFLEGEPAGDWHLEIRDRLQRRYLDALVTLGDRLLLAGAPARGADVFRRVLARDELHEGALLSLMRCYAGMGERAQAMRAFRRFADRMREELSARPGEDAARLFEQLQVGDGR